VACGSSGTSEFNPPLDDLKSGEAGLQDPPPTFDDAASGTLNDDGGTGGIPDDGGLKACATEQQQATLLPLDLYIMQDTSGSMSDPASGSTSKYDAVRTAMNAFVNDPASAGMGVGLQFFPQFKPGAPATCTTATSCGAFGPCNIHVCVAAGPIKYCTQDSDCGAGVKCGDLGECAIGNTPCAKSGGQVVGCVNSTFCLGYASGYCTGRDSCTATDYSTPNVPIQLLPGVAAQITAAFNSKTPEGLTPSSAALQGAIDRAKAHALANPGHTVVAVLATDGLPTECDTNMNNIAAIAAAAYAGTPSIKTFVIGVFAQAEQAQATTNLNQISNAGGTGNAFIINTSQNVAQQFLAALNQIRGSALPCQYAVPMPESGTPDFGKVNVQFSRSNGTKSTIVYVSDVNGCDPNTGGWYYDVNPSSGTPTKILLCPASCNAVKADSQGKIDVLLGCKSITSTPK
jgi:hypothetical protein